MEDCWSYVRVISAALGIDSEPVGVTYTDDEPAVEVEPGAYTVCGAIQKAASGGVVRLSEEFCACSGGKAHIGLTVRGEIPWKLLVEGEKLWCDVKTAVRSHAAVEKLAKPPVGLARTVFLYPVRAGIFKPDLVLMLVNAEQAARLITLVQFWDGQLPSFEMRGPLCWSAITYPLISGEFNLTVGDISARRMEQWEPEHFVATIPWERVHGIAEAVPCSTAGTAEPSDRFRRMTERMREQRSTR